jgi:hypothetical protein
MHDGIHKNAPVIKEWKSCVKACTQEVWKNSAPQQAEKIILKQRKELKPIVEQAQVLLSNPQTCLNSSMEIEPLRYCFCTTSLQEKFIDSLERHLAHHSPQPIHQACKSVIQENLDANLRNIDGHLALKFPQKRAEINNRLHQTIKLIDIEKHVKELVAGVKPQPTRLPPLALDEAIA